MREDAGRNVHRIGEAQAPVFPEWPLEEFAYNLPLTILKALFRRATELGILLGGADRTTHLFGRRITQRYRGKLQTVLDRRNEGQPIPVAATLVLSRAEHRAHLNIAFQQLPMTLVSAK